MRKNLLTLMLSMVCIFLFAGSLIAETKTSNRNLIKASNSLNIVKNNTLNRNTLIVKYEKLKQSCGTSVDWTCSSALDHTQRVMDTSTGVCQAEGYASQSCGDYLAWARATLEWAAGYCLLSMAIRAEPQKVIVNDYKRLESLG
jgi:hypothetical protein